MIIILILVLPFHLFVLAGVIDFRNVWAGRLSSKEQMYIFESVSICFNAFLLFIIFQKAGYIKPLFSPKFVNIALWIFVVVFALNTVGNLFASSKAEKFLATPLTLLSCYLCYRIARSQPQAA